MSWSALYLTCSQPQISSTWGHRAFLTLLMDGVTRGSDSIPAKCSISHHGGRGKVPSTSLPLVFVCVYSGTPSAPASLLVPVHPSVPQPPFTFHKTPTLTLKALYPPSVLWSSPTFGLEFSGETVLRCRFLMGIQAPTDFDSVAGARKDIFNKGPR